MRFEKNNNKLLGYIKGRKFVEKTYFHQVNEGKNKKIKDQKRLVTYKKKLKYKLAPFEITLDTYLTYNAMIKTVVDV